MIPRKLSAVAVLAALTLTLAAAPSPAGAAAYRHYVACGVGKKAAPSHRCAAGAKKGAFFKSNRGDVRYTVCLRLPAGRSLCAKGQSAEQGVLYVNRITSTVRGKHRIAWFVKGKRVGAFFFRVT